MSSSMFCRGCCRFGWPIGGRTFLPVDCRLRRAAFLMHWGIALNNQCGSWQQGIPLGLKSFLPISKRLRESFRMPNPEFLAELANIYSRYDSKLLGSPPVG